MKPVKNKLRVLHYPQVPCEPFIVSVKDEYEAKKIMDVLAEQHLFLYNNNFIPDYSNIIVVQVWDEDANGEGDADWLDYYNEEEGMEWDELEETYLSDITVI